MTVLATAIKPASASITRRAAKEPLLIVRPPRRVDRRLWRRIGCRTQAWRRLDPRSYRPRSAAEPRARGGATRTDGASRGASYQDRRGSAPDLRAGTTA